MKLHPYQLRLIKEWWNAAKQGRRLVIQITPDAGLIPMYRRMEQIMDAHPSLFLC